MKFKSHVGLNMKKSLLAAVILSALPTVAFSDVANDFVKSLEGKYTARGTAEIVKGKTDRVSCKITNEYSAGVAELKMAGKCASVRGKGNIAGSIKVSNGKIAGGFWSNNKDVKVTQSSGTVSKSKMVLTSSLMNEKLGSLSKMQQIISKTSTGFNAEFYLFDRKTGKFKKTGSLKLKAL